MVIYFSKRKDTFNLFNNEEESLKLINILIINDEIMGICPYCKQHIVITDVEIEKLGKGVAEQDRMYVCPVCNYILGFANESNK